MPLSGSFAMDDGTRFTGGWKGRFYGPANQEVGAVWYMSSVGGEYASAICSAAALRYGDGL